MHENTQRRCLLFGFLGLCVVPTLWTVGWVISHQFSYRGQRIEQVLSRELGLDVRVGRVSYPRPRQILLEDLSAHDWETAETLATARLVELVQVRGGAIVVCSQPTLHIDDMAQLWEMLRHRGLRRPWPTGQQFDIHAHSLTLKTPESSQTVSFLAKCQNHASGPRVEVEVQLAGEANQPPLRLRLERQRTGNIPATIVQVTCPRPIPCTLFGPALNLPATFGAGASFRGALTAIDRGDHWRLHLRDVTMSDVQLHQLVQRLPFKLSGIATIHCAEAKISPDGVSARLSLDAGPGHVGAPLLRSLATAWNCQLREQSEVGERTRIRYEHVGTDIEINQSDQADTVTIRGTCPGAEPGVLIADGQGALLTEPSKQPRPIEFATAFLPAAETQLPAVRESLHLLRLLRLPDSLEARTEPGPPQAKVQYVTAEEVAD